MVKISITSMLSLGTGPIDLNLTLISMPLKEFKHHLSLNKKKSKRMRNTMILH